MKNIIDSYNQSFDKYAYFYFNHPGFEENIEMLWVTNEVMNGEVSDSDFNFKFVNEEICEVYHFQNGICGESSWLVIGKLKNELYFCFDADCAFEGFDCQGSTNIIFARSWNSLYEFGLDDYLRFQVDRND